MVFHSRQKITFLHGFLGSPLDWEGYRASFPDMHTIALPGHAARPLYSLDELYNIIPHDSHVVGYSLGGRLALRLLFSYPPKFSSLTLIATHLGLTDGHDTRWQEDLHWAHLLDTLPLEQFIHAWYNRPLFAGFSIPSHRYIQNKEHLKEILLTYSLAKQPLYNLEEVRIPLLRIEPEASDNHAIHLTQTERIIQKIKQGITYANTMHYMATN